MKLFLSLPLPYFFFYFSMSTLQWISDKLHDLVGYSDKVVAEFVLQKAKDSVSANALLRSLTSAETLPESSASLSFANELWAKIPRIAKVDAVTARHEAEKKAREDLIKSRSYALVDDIDDEPSSSSKAREKSGSSKTTGEVKSKNIRKRADDLLGDDEDEPPTLPAKKNKYDDAPDEAEEAKDRDIEERDALAARLREKDLEKTKVFNQGSKKAMEEAKKRQELAEADRAKVCLALGFLKLELFVFMFLQLLLS